jgi:hypothetical protein
MLDSLIEYLMAKTAPAEDGERNTRRGFLKVCHC